VIFMTQHMRAAQHKSAAAQEAALKTANMESAAVIGFTAALAAYGGFFIPKSFGTSVALTGGPQAALYGFIAFYISCLALTWWCYARKNAPMPC
jgi:MFS transporter, NNP family, nitrate/nitrite transporter